MMTEYEFTIKVKGIGASKDEALEDALEEIGWVPIADVEVVAFEKKEEEAA